uniref:Synaptotagmin 3 n=1 Tax=Erpetoichthys calabaricus TaxID=27687 RepID=A0A8C4SFN1_ERPCA
MSGDWEDEICKSALTLVQELCFNSGLRAYEANERCQDFSYLLRDRGRTRHTDTDISVSLLSVIVTFCGIVLLGVSLFVSWKLCWIPWRDKEGSDQHSSSSLYHSPHPPHPHFSEILVVERVELGGQSEMPEHSYLDMDSYPPGQTSPELPPSSESLVSASQNRDLPNAHSQHQVAVRSSPRSVTHQLSSPDFHIEDRTDQATCIGQIKPELYKMRSDQGDGKKVETGNCGKISFLLRYAYNTEQLVVKILKALDLPAKDANGFSDPYVKIYLLPDRKKKFQTKVHRKTLNPVFNETFHFGVPFAELQNRKLHFSVYDFDRFSRHDLIGQVVVDNLLEFSENPDDKPVWRDIVEATAEKADLGEVNFSLCYLPTAGRLTVTIIKATNLKAMDLTGFSGKSLCEKKENIHQENTLNPVYNEALVFDIPNENIDHVSLVIAVMDYDCIGHNEVIGMCRVGHDADSPGRDHWAGMLANPRKPIEHWHQLVEEKTMNSYVTKSSTTQKPHIIVESPHSE